MLAIKKIVDAWVRMWNTYDLNQIDLLFLASEKLTYFSSEKEGAFQGIEAVQEHHRGFGFVAGGKASDNKLWLDDIRVTDFDSSVVVTAIWFFQRPTGRTQKGPVTFVYVLADDQYRIAHVNFDNYPDAVGE